jgi:hypothetical protein
MNNPHTQNHSLLLEGCSWAWQHCVSHQVQKQMMETATNFLMMNLSLMRGSHQAQQLQKGVLSNGEQMLIPVMAKMIHSAVWDLERFVLKDSRLLHMVKLVAAIRNFCVNIKHAQIDVKDGTRLVRVILWRKEKECMAQGCLIDKCNSKRYICVIREVEDYYGVHKIIAFNVQPVSSGNEVTHHFFWR